MSDTSSNPPVLTSLSARLLVLTMVFVMLAEVLIYLPSIGRYRKTWLDERLAAAHLATLAQEAAPDGALAGPLRLELLRHVGAHAVELFHDEKRVHRLAGSAAPAPDMDFNLLNPNFFLLIRDAVDVLMRTENRVIRVIGVSPRDFRTVVAVTFDEWALRRAILAYSERILALSIFISVLTATLLFLSLQAIIVAPVGRLTREMLAFREDPKGHPVATHSPGRSDEIGMAQRVFSDMQGSLKNALLQQQRLAALGTAVTKINHDLRNILANAYLLTDRLADFEDPEVQRWSQPLVKALDRAVTLCEHTLTFTREGPPHLNRTLFYLADLIDEVASTLVPDIGTPEFADPEGNDASTEGSTPPSDFRLHQTVDPMIELDADYDQLHRVLLNLAKNAQEAGAKQVEVSASLETPLTAITAEDPRGEDLRMVQIDVADDGPGLSPKAKTHLFKPFLGSARRGGTGLGLVIAREIAAAHKGSLSLVHTESTGTLFRLTLPVAENDI